MQNASNQFEAVVLSNKHYIIICRGRWQIQSNLSLRIPAEHEQLYITDTSNYKQIS